MLFDVQSQQWATLAKATFSWPEWSSDSQYLYAMDSAETVSLDRIRISDRKVDRVVDLKDFVASDSRPVVAALRDPVAFSAIRVEMDTVVRTNGFDLAPEFLRAKLRTHAPA